MSNNTKYCLEWGGTVLINGAVPLACLYNVQLGHMMYTIGTALLNTAHALANLENRARLEYNNLIEREGAIRFGDLLDEEGWVIITNFDNQNSPSIMGQHLDDSYNNDYEA